jgi:hypothetical protein
MWDVDVEWIEPWLLTLDDDSYEQVVAALELLKERGPHLGRPIADRVSGSRHHNMKELRPGSRGSSELRLLFAFDPLRRAIVLVGGDKAGNWKQWYSTSIAIADDRFESHLEALRRNDGKDA